MGAMRIFYPIVNVLTRVVFIMTLIVGIAGNWWDILQTKTAFGLTWQGLTFILFALSSLYVLIELYLSLRKYEASYEYALAFEGVSVTDKGGNSQIGLIFKNTIDKPIGYKVDTDSLYLEFGGNRPINPIYSITGGVIPIGGSDQFIFALLKTPNNFPCKGKVSFRLHYGNPHKMAFAFTKNMDFDINYGNGIVSVYPIYNSK